VEVKTRWSGKFGLSQAAVTPKKQQQISLVAAHYLQANQLFDQPCRFDVVAIRLNWQNRLIGSPTHRKCAPLYRGSRICKHLNKSSSHL